MAAGFAQWFLNGAMFANPIGLTIGLTFALAAALAYLYWQSETARAGFQFPYENLFEAWKLFAEGVRLVVDQFERLIDVIGRLPSLPVPGPLGGLLGGLGGIDIPGIPFLANGGTVPVGGRAVVGERGPELAENTGSGTRITPMGGGRGGGTRMLQPLYIQVDGRTIAEVVVDIAETAGARR
jgi:hypothetical protein